MNQFGLDHYIELAKVRSDMLYKCIAESNGYYKVKITDDAYKSKVNVIFRIQNGNTELEAKWIAEAAAAGIL
jgi:phosphoserine aminotransferase